VPAATYIINYQATPINANFQRQMTYHFKQEYFNEPSNASLDCINEWCSAMDITGATVH